MTIDNGNLTLAIEDDYEFINLVIHLLKIGHGEATVRMKDRKPYMVVETIENFILTRAGQGGTKEKQDKEIGNALNSLI